MADARSEVLARIRSAIGVATPEAVEREYRRVGDLTPDAVLDLFAERVADYRATVVRLTEDEVPSAIATALPGGRVLVPPGLPESWVPDGATVDSGFTATELDGFAAVVTGCAAAAGETGTIVLDGSPDQGRRAITLVPDVHVCVVRSEQVVQTVPELLARLDPKRPLTFVSGPSATSDIELNRVEGVHGPRTLTVLLVR